MSSIPSQIATGVAAIPFAYLAWRTTGKYLDEYFTRKTTVMYELENIGVARPDNQRIKGTAVICGGSIAGLWSALAAADHFEDVLIVEPEAWVGTDLGTSNSYDAKGDCVLEKTPPRTRVMQYANSVHVFQPMAYNALKKYFPNFDEEVKSANGRVQEYNVHSVAFGRQFLKLPKNDSPNSKSPQCFWLSREAYERLLRRLVLESSTRIRWMTGLATGVRLDPKDPSKLSSVTIRLPVGGEKDVPATLVIDCSGGTQAGLRWLRRISSEPKNAKKLQKLAPPGTLPWDQLRVSYDCKQRFISFRFYVPPEARDSLPIPGGYENNVWPYTYLPIPGKEHKFFIINRVEGHRVGFAFCGWGDPELPQTLDDVVDWFKKFEIDHGKVPDWVYALYDKLLEYRDQCEVMPSRYPGQSWIFWESAPFIPSNFIAIGDSVMRVNPTFGQGCSKAAIGSITLDGMLRRQPYAGMTSIPDGFGREFFKVHREKIEGIWDGTKPTDYMFSTTIPVQGEKLSDEWLKGSIANLVMELAGLDDKVDAELFKVRFFMAPPQSLFKPQLLLKYAAFALRKQLGMVPVA